MRIPRSVSAQLLILSAFLIAPTSARAQRLSLGGEIGPTLATMASDRDGLDRVWGFTAGLDLAWHTNDAVAFASGMRWIRKGTSGTMTGVEEPLAMDLRLDYLQVPLIVSLSRSLTSGLRPMIFAGPAVAFELGCEARTDPFELALTLGCGGPADARATVDWSGLVGAGVAWDADPVTFILRGQYDVGLTRIDQLEDPQFPELRNRAFTVTTGLRWPIG
jgi:hypothetical protein